jgi:hypothetical protein
LTQPSAFPRPIPPRGGLVQNIVKSQFKTI